MHASVIEARRDQPLHAELAHVAQRHRWARWVLGPHLSESRGCCSVVLVPLRSAACDFLRRSLFCFPLRLRFGGLALLDIRILASQRMLVSWLFFLSPVAQIFPSSTRISTITNTKPRPPPPE